MLVTRNPQIARRCRIMRLHGINRDAFDRYTSTKPSWYYEIVAPGFKYNMTDVAASLGIHQLKKVWELQKQRNAIANHYDLKLANLPLHLPAKPPQQDIHSWHLYVIRLDDSVKVSRNTFIEQMAAKGIGCSVHYIPLHLQPYWRDTYNLRTEQFPCASYAYERIVSLPIYTKMTESDQTCVMEIVKKTLN
jgi:dTDP-4-amino-4,6-dideoxygalactose transaminase